MNLKIKKIPALVLSLSLVVSQVPSFAVVVDTEYKDAVKNAMTVTEDMIVSVGDNLSAAYIAQSLFTYNEKSNAELEEKSGISAEYIIDLGEEPPLVGTYRSFVAGNRNDVKGKVEIFASDDVTDDYVLIGASKTMISGSWNDISLTSDRAYRYIKVVPENKLEIIEETEDVEEKTSDEEEKTDDITITIGDNSVEYTESDKSSASVKTVFIVGNAMSDTDDNDRPLWGNTDTGAAGGIATGVSIFPDCRGHWAERIINECADKEYLNGYDDGTFKPDNPVTAAEFAKIYDSWSGNLYQITIGYWAMPYIRDLLDKGMFDNGEYADYSTNMTREQVAKSVICSLKGEYFPKNLDKYKTMISDFGNASEKYGDYVAKAYISGIISGYEDGSFRPQNSVTRAEILTIINRTLNPEMRVIPESVGAEAMNAPETYTYYTAASQVRKNTNANGQNYRIFGKNAQYMEENDDASGLKIMDEVQGAQGMAFILRYDLTDILKREDKLKNISLVANWGRNGDFDLGLFWYEYRISSFNWSMGVTKVVNGSSVAGDDKTGYNSIIDNISAILPTWNDIKNAVPPEEKTKPFTTAKKDGNNQYIFELSLDELKAHMNENNMVEFFITTVNYDRYGVEKDNKPQIYTAGEKAPQIYCEFETAE